MQVSFNLAHPGLPLYWRPHPLVSCPSIRASPSTRLTPYRAVQPLRHLGVLPSADRAEIVALYFRNPV